MPIPITIKKSFSSARVNIFGNNLFKGLNWQPHDSQVKYKYRVSIDKTNIYQLDLI